MVHVCKVLAFFLALCFPLAAIAQSTEKKQIDFVYFGSQGCPSCRAWKAFDLPKLKEAPAFQKVRFTEVVKAIASPVPSAYWFPEEIKHLREPIANKMNGAGSPMFAILTDGQVVASWKGTKKSPDEVIKIIERELGRSTTATPNTAVNADAAR